MIVDDLFAEFELAAQKEGWVSVRPRPLQRTYVKGRFELRVYANATGTAVTRVSALYEDRLMESRGPNRPQKREIALAWLEHRR